MQRLIYNLRRQLITDAKPILKRIEWLTHLILICLSSKPARQSRGLIMPHGIGTTAPSGATMQKQGVEPSPYQIRNKDYHIVKERSAYSPGYSVRFVWYRLNPRRESEPEALHYVVLLGCSLALVTNACQHPQNLTSYLVVV